MSIRTFFAPLAAALAFASCGSDPSGTCVTSQQCEAGQECVGGQCLTASAPECRNDPDCGADRYCDMGTCRPRQINNHGQTCTRDGECAARSVCEGDLCVPGCGETGSPITCTSQQTCNTQLGRCEAKAPLTCSGDTGCQAPSVCEGQACVPGCGVQGTTMICGATETCNSARGRCEPAANTCNTDAECGPPASICEGNRCVGGCTVPNGLACTNGDVCNNATGRCVVSTPPPCANDAACGAPASICELQACVPGCGAPGAPACGANTACDTNTGRCRPIAVSCSNDAACGAPTAVCEGTQCVPGCGQPGGLQCSGATQCNQATGRCDPFTVPCTTDASCAPPSSICSGTSCVPGCATSGCTGTQVCNRTTGHCEAGPPPPTCTADAMEDNDSLSAPRAVNAGTHGNLTACTGDEDWYSFALAVGARINVQVNFSHAEGDIDLELKDPSGTTVVRSAGTHDNEVVTHTAATAGTYLIRVWLFTEQGSTPGNRYTLVLTHTPAPVCGGDRFEENDTRAAAKPLTALVERGLAACAGDDDYFQIPLQRGDQLQVDATFAAAEGNIDLSLFDPAGTSVQQAVTTGDNETLRHLATTGGTYVLRVTQVADAGGAPGNPYDFTVTVTPTCLDDSYEVNNRVSQATRLTAAGTINGLQACVDDDDYFSVDLAAGQTFTVDVLFTNAEGDIDLSVFNAAGEVVTGGLSSNDDESASFTASAAGTYFVVPYLYRDAGARPGNGYTLRTTF